MASATLVVAHHEPDNEGLRSAAKEFAQAASSSNSVGPFAVYRPVSGTVGAGQDAQLKFLWAPHRDGDINAPALAEAHGEERAQALVDQARSAINGIGSRDLERTRSNRGESASLPKYVVAVGISFDESKLDELKKAADAFDEANEASDAKLGYSVYKTGGEGHRLILITADSVDESVAHSRIRKHHGDAKADEIRRSVEGIVKSAYALPLVQVPEFSNA